MIDKLEAELAKAKKDKQEIVAPYDKRIRKLKQAIRSVKDFNDLSSEINESGKPEVSLLKDDYES